MKKSIALSTAALLSCSMLQAANIQVDGKDAGKVEFQLKAMHIMHDQENGFAPSNGSGWLAKVKYETPNIIADSVKLGVGMYANGDTGLTEWDEFDPANGERNKPAKGMFTDHEGTTKALMGEAYLSYKNGSTHAKVGRQILNTPLTKIKWSLMPNFYQAAVAGTKAGDFSITAAHVDKMSFGSRAMTDWGLIGERTGTAGVAVKLTEDGGSVDQAKFYNMGTIAGVGKQTDGITVAGIGYKPSKSFDMNLWAYSAWDIANMYYVDTNYGMKITDGMKMKVSAQYLKQVDTGDELAGQVNYDLYGAKVGLGSKKLGAYVAYNQSSSGDQFVNAFGSDPAYTSSLFSRNAYRKDVKAYKVGGHYVITKGLKFMASYAQYGRSNTLLSNSGTEATNGARNNAYEADFILAYKPTKAWMFKIFNAVRTSEYDGITSGGKVTGRKMNHIRVIASYTF